MPILVADTWHHVVFHPLNHPAWLALAEEWQPTLSPYLLLAIMRGTPLLVYALSEMEIAVERGFGVSINDTVIAASKQVESVTMPSVIYPFRAAKDKDGNLYVLADHNGQQNATLKRYEAADAAALKVFL